MVSWLAILGAAFSVGDSVNANYTAALAPAVAAIIGIGIETAWSSGHRWVPFATGLVVFVSVAYAAWLLPRNLSTPPSWLRPAAIVVGVVGLAVVALAAVRRRRRMLAASLVVSLVAICFTPTVAALSIVANHEGAFDTPFEPGLATEVIDSTFIAAPARVVRSVPSIEQARLGAPYLLLTQTAALASLYIDATGEEVLPIGSFSGTGPSPTLAQVESDVCDGTFHLALITDGPDPRLQWIAQHCRDVSVLSGGLQTYFCLPPAGR